jgi:hypothetical protein
MSHCSAHLENPVFKLPMSHPLVSDHALWMDTFAFPMRPEAPLLLVWIPKSAL